MRETEPTYLQNTAPLDGGAAALTASVVHRQHLGVAVAVAVVGHLLREYGHLNLNRLGRRPS